MAHRDAPRAGRTTWRRLALVLAPALLIGSLTTSAPAASQDVPTRPPSRPASQRRGRRATRDRMPSPPPAAIARGSRRRTWPRPCTTTPDGPPRPRTSRPSAATRRARSGSRWRPPTRRPASGRSTSVDGTNVIVGGNLVEADVRTEPAHRAGRRRRRAARARAPAPRPRTRSPRASPTTGSGAVAGRRLHGRRLHGGRDRRRLHRLRQPPRHRAPGAPVDRPGPLRRPARHPSTAPPSPRSSTTWRPMPRSGWCASTPTSRSSTRSTPCRRRSTW